MRQTKAKALRKAVYGTGSKREKEYKQVGGTVVCIGKRAEYLKAKKAAR